VSPDKRELMYCQTILIFHNNTPYNSSFGMLYDSTCTNVQQRFQYIYRNVDNETNMCLSASFQYIPRCSSYCCQ